MPVRGQRRIWYAEPSDTDTCHGQPYSENTDTAKAVAQAISYDYADLLEKDTGYISARTDVADKNKKVLYQPLYEVYAKSGQLCKVYRGR